MKMAVKVMIADDHSMIREGLKQLLELEGDFEVIEEACDVPPFPFQKRVYFAPNSFLLWLHLTPSHFKCIAKNV